MQVAAGRHACTFDLESGRPLRRFESGSERNVLHSPRVEGTRDGRLLFIGNAEGDLLAYDLRCDLRQFHWLQEQPVHGLEDGVDSLLHRYRHRFACFRPKRSDRKV